MPSPTAEAVRVVDVPERERFEVRVGDELAGFAEYRRRPGLIAFTHTMIDPRFEGQKSIVSQGVHSAMAAPLFDNQKVLGALYADSRLPGFAFDEEQLQLFTILANMAAVKITNARLLETEQGRLRMTQELATATRIQRALLPRPPALRSPFAPFVPKP